MKVHEVKSWPFSFEPILIGTKPFDLRQDDRGYSVGDILKLREFDPVKGYYTGRDVSRKITFIQFGEGAKMPSTAPPGWGLEPGFVILGLQ